MKEAQREGAGAILHSRYQATPAAENDIRRAHFGLNDKIRAFAGGGNRCDTGAILVAQGQMEKQVLHMSNAVIRQRLGKLWPYSAQLAHVDSIEPIHWCAIRVLPHGQ